MGKKLNSAARILIVLSVSVSFFGCSYFFKGKPTASYRYVLRADQGDLLRKMSEYSRDSLFNAAVSEADSPSDDGAGNFMDELTKIYGRKNAEDKLAPIFVSVPQWIEYPLHPQNNIKA
jgi:hypothetical protein